MVGLPLLYEDDLSDPEDCEVADGLRYVVPVPADGRLTVVAETPCLVCAAALGVVRVALTLELVLVRLAVARDTDVLVVLLDTPDDVPTPPLVDTLLVNTLSAPVVYLLPCQRSSWKCPPWIG